MQNRNVEQKGSTKEYIYYSIIYAWKILKQTKPYVPTYLLGKDMKTWVGRTSPPSERQVSLETEEKHYDLVVGKGLKISESLFLKKQK